MQDPQAESTGTPSPRESLGQCHRCIAAMLERLEALVLELSCTPAGSPAGDLAERGRALVAEIDEALGVHMLDEEVDVFPAILAAADSPARRAQAFELVSSLLVGHRELAELWHALRIPLLALGGGVSLPIPGGTAADFLIQLRRHLQREEAELGDLVGFVDPARSRAIAASIAARHDEACPRATRCPLK